MTQDTVFSAVQTAVVEALGVGEDEVTPDATVMDDLGAESIDLLDMLFRIERKIGVKVKAADVAAYIQGGIPDEEFGDADGKISAVGLAHLKKVMPQIDPDELAGKLEAEKVINLLTVRNLADLVAQRAAAAAG
jgi:acyl carrier protein